MFQDLEDDGQGNSVIKEYFTGYTPWMVKHRKIGLLAEDYLLVGEQTAVHLYQII